MRPPLLPVIFRGHHEAGFFAHALGLSAERSPLTVLPGNERTAEARYACLIAVQDFYRMRAAVKDAGEWHYSLIEPAIFADVRAGRAVLVFDLCNEGPAYDPGIFSELYAWIETQRLPAGRCVWLAQNRRIADGARAAAGERAKLIRFEHYDYFVKIMAWIFSPSSPEVAMGVDADAYIGRLFDARGKDRLLLCLNATPRLPRVLTVAALMRHRLLDKSLVSFPGMDYVKSGVSLQEVREFLKATPDLEYLRPCIDAVAQLPPMRVDPFPERGNALVEKIDPRVYERTYFSLVTESDFSDPFIERVTEKTVKAFCMGHPTLVVGNARSIAFMTDLGFQDGGEVFNRAADALSDPSARFNRVVEDVLRQAARIATNRHAWLDRVREVGTHNFRYAVSGEFLAQFVKNCDLPLAARLAALVAPA